jgi:hypothetical protein
MHLTTIVTTRGFLQVSCLSCPNIVQPGLSCGHAPSAHIGLSKPYLGAISVGSPERRPADLLCKAERRDASLLCLWPAGRVVQSVVELTDALRFRGLVRAWGRSEERHYALSRHAVELRDPLGAETFLSKRSRLYRPQPVSDVVQFQNGECQHFDELRMSRVLEYVGVRVAGQALRPHVGCTLQCRIGLGSVVCECFHERIDRRENFVCVSNRFQGPATSISLPFSHRRTCPPPRVSS